MNGAPAFSRPDRKGFGVSAVKFSGSLFTAVTGLAMRDCSAINFLSAKYFVSEASVVQHCNHVFVATLNQSFPASAKVWGSGRFKLPNNLFLC